MAELTLIQKEIHKAIEQMSEKATFTEAVLAKKVRENIKLEGKKKAGLCLADMVAAVDILAEEGIFYSVHVNSVNECLFKKETEKSELALEAKQRRQRSEKSIVLITSGDVGGGKSKTGKTKSSKEKRSERKKMNIYENYDD